MKKAEFLSLVNECIEREDVNFLVVAVSGVGEVEELIINHKINMPTKKDYYDKSYNNDMELNFNNNIKITFVAGLERLSDLTKTPDLKH